MWERIVGACAVVSCLLVPLAGCGAGGKGDRPQLVPVTGSIVCDGKTAAGVMVNFWPIGQTRGQGASAVTDASGAYQLKTHGTEPGAPAGEYKVTCEKYVMPDGSDFDVSKGVSPHESGAKQVLPPTYSDKDQTTLKATVPEQGGKFDFQVESK